VFYARKNLDECTGFLSLTNALAVNCSTAKGTESFFVDYQDSLRVSLSREHEVFLNNRLIFSSSPVCDGAFLMGRAKGMYVWDISTRMEIGLSCHFVPLLVPRVVERWRILPDASLVTRIDNEDLLYCTPPGRLLQERAFEFEVCADTCTTLSYDISTSSPISLLPSWIWSS
jgi:hypothetical protein